MHIPNYAGKAAIAPLWMLLFNPSISNLSSYIFWPHPENNTALSGPAVAAWHIATPGACSGLSFRHTSFFWLPIFTAGAEHVNGRNNIYGDLKGP
jgi:hypothetical protein